MNPKFAAMFLLILAGLAPQPLLQENPPRLLVWPDRAPPGMPVNILGMGFAPGAMATLYFDSQIMGFVQVGDKGELYEVLLIPRDTPTGTHTIMVEDSEGHKAQHSIVVEYARVVVDPDTAEPGDKVVINARGLPPGYTYYVYFDSLLCGIYQPLENGTLKTVLIVPASISGTHSIRIVYPGNPPRPGSTVIVGEASILIDNGTVLEPELAGLVENLSVILESLKYELDILGIHVHELSDRLASLEHNASRLEERLVNIETYLEDISTRLDAVKMLIDGLAIKLGDLDERLNSTLTSLSTGLLETLRLIQAMDEEMSRINGKLESLEKQSNASMSALGRISGDLSNLEDELRRQEALIGNLASSLDIVKTSISELNTSLPLLKNDIESKYSDVLGQLSRIRDNYNNIEERLTKLNSSITGIETGSRELEGEVRDIEAEINIIKYEIILVLAIATAIILARHRIT